MLPSWCWPPPWYSSSEVIYSTKFRSRMPRTRSESAHKKVMYAALELVSARGVDAVSMDAIAAKSGVSKATIYKHWTDKEALLLEMMASITGLDSRPRFDSGDTRADMAAVLSYRPKED